MLVVSIGHFRAQDSLLWSKPVANGVHTSNHKFSAIDNIGNMYFTGSFSVPKDFELGAGTKTLAPAGGPTLFLYKLSPDGVFLWIRKLGIGLYSILVTDHHNNIIVCSGEDIFKLNPEGKFIWIKKIEGGDARARDVRVDKDNNILIAGTFIEDTDFDPGIGQYILRGPGYGPYSTTWYAGFVLKLSEQGNFHWAEKIEINKKSTLVRMALNEDEIFLTYKNAESESELVKLDKAGEKIWLQNFGPEFNLHVIESDQGGNLLCAGTFTGNIDADPGEEIKQFSTSMGTMTLSNGMVVNDYDLLLIKLKTTGQFNWARQIGGKAGEVVKDLYVGPDALIYVTGSASGATDFDPSEGYYSLKSKRKDFGYYAIYDTLGNFVCANEALATSHPTLQTTVHGIHVDESNNIYTVASQWQYGVYMITKVRECRLTVEKEEIGPPTDGRFTVFPNPSEGKFQINAVIPCYYRLLDMTGKILLKGDLQEGKNTVHTGSYSGLCILELQNQDLVQRFKVVIR